jgi:hypothetical protein
MSKILIFLIVLLYYTSARANDTVVIASKWYKIDQSKKIIVVNRSVDDINSIWTQPKTVIQLDTFYSFVTPINQVVIGEPYSISIPSEFSYYSLFFSELPIISITTDNEIVDEPRVLANFTIVESNGQEIKSNIGIEYRGGFSQSLPKKSFRIEFWEDEIGNQTRNVNLLGLKEDDDWNLQAMYNEPLRLTSKTSNDLWRMIHTIYYQKLEPEAINGIRMKYVDLFLNGEYRGVYCVGERINRKQLKLKKYNGSIRGELYKGALWDGSVTFDSLPIIDNNSSFWGGFEFSYPDEIIDWSNLYNFVDFVMHSSESEFYSTYQTKFNIDNAVDYFIFLNLIRATDNTGKNIFVAKYTSNEPYFYVPWDLDGTFGTSWTGAADNFTTDILSNGFYNRLWLDCSENGFRARLKQRWNELRSTIISTNKLMSMFNASYNYLESNGSYKREAIAWNEYSADTNQLSYMKDWIALRITYLDSVFTEPCSHINRVWKKSCEYPNREKRKLTLYPNPTSNSVHLKGMDKEDFQLTIFT